MRAGLLALAVVMTGCGPTYVVLVNDKGERVICERPVSYSEGLISRLAVESRIKECVEAHEKLGFRRVE